MLNGGVCTPGDGFCYGRHLFARTLVRFVATGERGIKDCLLLPCPLPSDHLPQLLDAHNPSTRTSTNTVFPMPPPNTHDVLRAIPAVVGPSVMHEGWVLKKRRKKMQGTEVLLPASKCIDSLNPPWRPKLVRFRSPLLYSL